MSPSIATAISAADAAGRLASTGLPWCWLDGEAAAPGERRVSYLGVAAAVREAQAGEASEFLLQLRETGDTVAYADGSARGFTSGWVPVFGYEYGVELLGLDPHPTDAAPAFALRLDAVLQIDHETGERTYAGDATAANELRAIVETDSPHVDRATASATNASEPQWRSRDAEYLQQVEACKAAIHRGDAYVLCLTDTAESSTHNTPLELYLRLRDGGVASRGAVVAREHRALISASPERFLSVNGARIATHPIKGTRPRGDTADADAALATELASDPKERAENLMIVDLMRNDLSRVCEPGSVRVSRFLDVEQHPRVHQLVSTVEGELAFGRDVYDAIEACFPGGSMTGAPKISAVRMLRSLEHGPRGLYSGCFGWIDDSGDAELAMTIRGIELRGDSNDPAGVRAFVGAGGGITAESVASRERDERNLKAAALLKAL